MGAESGMLQCMEGSYSMAGLGARADADSLLVARKGQNLFNFRLLHSRT